MTCRHNSFSNISTDWKKLMPENKDWNLYFDNYRECDECGVWKGNRTDSHCYDANYYQGCNIMDAGIPTREWYFNIHSTIWNELAGTELRPTKTLELGCSIGRLLWSLHRKYGTQCTGIESSKYAYEWQQQTYGFDENYKVLHTDCESYDWSKLGKLDFIYACHVLEHMISPTAIIQKCADQLEPGGYVYLVVPDKEHQLTLHIHNWCFDEEVFKKWFTQAGLEVVGFKNIKPHNPPPPPHMDYKGHYICVLARKP